MQKPALLAPVVLVAALAACTPSLSIPNGTTTSAATKPKTVASTDAKTGKTVQVGQIKGVVVGPQGYKKGNPAPVPNAKLSQGYQVRQAAGATATASGEATVEVPIEGVQVFLASQQGERFAGPTIGTTDVKGEFTIKNVSTTASFLIMTDTSDPEQRHKELCGIMQTLETSQEVRISYATTIVTLNTLQSMAGNALGTFQAQIYGQLVAAVDAKIKTIPVKELPDVSDINQVTAFMAKVEVNGKPATALVEDLRTGLKANGIDASALQGMLIDFNASGSATVNGQNAGSGSTSGTVGVSQDLVNAIFGTPAPSPTPDPTN